MRPRLVIIVSSVLFVASVGSVVVGAHTANASSRHQARKAPDAGQFVGYWMGIDPLDGGDSRRAITRSDDRRFSVVGRDTVFTLCDGTDRAIVTSDDALIVGSALVSDNLVITCFGNGSTVRLKVRYEPVDEHILRETVTTQAGQPVDEIVFHRVSER
jgi:hypothetical protein